MGRPRKPTALHLIQGTNKAHPERMRARKNEPKPKSPIGAAPKHLNDDERRAWSELKRLCPQGVLSSSDRIIMEQASRMLVWLRDHSPDESSWTKVCIRLEAALGKMAMTPADRSRVVVHDA